METKHTPGPWFAIKPDGAPYFGIHGKDDVTIAGTSSGLSEADSRLAAAAPDLLEALRELLARSENFHAAGVKFSDFTAAKEAMTAARVAIAKALGVEANAK